MLDLKMLDLHAINRLKQIALVLFEHELHHVVSTIGLKGHLPFSKKLRCKNKNFEAQPETLRKVFEDLGGAFIKLGQLMALRPDLVGEKYSKEFSKLLHNVPAEKPDTIKKLVAHIPFTNFSSTPLGVGSIAQVHKAKLDGKWVAVKIKRPKVDEQFSRDIKLMEWAAKLIADNYELSFIDPVQIVEEFKTYTEKELDLSHEAANIRRFTNNFRNQKNVMIPKVYDKYTTNKILIMEFVEGTPINKIKKNKLVVKRLTDTLYKMLFEDRFFHADLHPGNILVNKGKLIFLDFGIVGYISVDFERKLFGLFANLVQGDLDGTADCLIDLDVGDDEPRIQVLKDGIYNVLGDYYDQPLKKIPFGNMFYGAVEVARQSRIKLPANFVLFGKSLVTMDGTCREIDPDFNVMTNAKPYVRKMIRKSLSPKRFVKNAKTLSYQLYEVINQLPYGMKDFLRKFTKIEERIIDIDKTFHNMTKTMWHFGRLISMSLLFATFFITSMIFINQPPLLYGYSMFFYLGMIASLVILVSLLHLFYEKP